MKKGYFFILIITTLMVVMIVIIVKRNGSVNKGEVYLPKLNLVSINGECNDTIFFNSSKIKVFIYFSSECSACSEEIRDLFKNLESLKEIQIVFVSNDKIETISSFIAIEGYTQGMFFYDINSDFYQKMKIKGLPTILIFNKKNLLIEKIVGAAPLKEIISIISSHG